MKPAVQLQTSKLVRTASSSPERSRLLQRKCRCGQGQAGQCEACGRMSDSKPSPGACLIGHHFAHVPVHPEQGPRLADSPSRPIAANAATDDEIHGPMVEAFREREREFGNPAAEELSPGEIKYGGLALSCPSETEVERAIDLTPTALSQGWRTGYGIVAVMKVNPARRTWDGTRITESLTQRSNTCPTRVGGDACAGHSTFTVGASGRSSRIGQLPGLVNRFYDFHVTRWRTGSLLHDPSRNPDDMDRCEAVCDQQYSCEGNVIGRHTVTRAYRKGVQNGQPVTIIDVAKT